MKSHELIDVFVESAREIQRTHTTLAKQYCLEILQEKGATIVPLKMYFNNRGKLKVLLGIGYGKNKVDKRETIKQREWDKSKARILKGK